MEKIAQPHKILGQEGLVQPQLRPCGVDHLLGDHRAGILKISEITLIDRFGRFGFDLFRKARGISNSPVKPNRVRKSIGSERTYGKLLYNEDMSINNPLYIGVYV